MPDRFTLEEHKKRMRDILRPQPVGGTLIERLREVSRKRRLPKPPTRSISSGI